MFDPDQYTTVPTRSPGATLSLARGLISASSSRPPPSLAKRLVKLRDRAKLLQMSWVDASRPAMATESLRQLDTVLDRRWNAMRGRLDACVQLGDDEHAPRAEKLLVVVFPTGLDFLKLAYPEEWAESERRLVLIETDELEGELAELAGKPYLPLLKQAHAAYGKALGITAKKEEAPESARVLEPLRDLKDAIASYARGVVGTVDEDDAKSVKAAQTQLEPILRARRTRPAGETEVEEVVEPIDAPLPELPAAVAEADEAAE
jgi:hypothetical protein